MRITQTTLRRIIKEELEAVLEAAMSDQEKLELGIPRSSLDLGNELLHLRGPAGFAQNYHMTDFEEFFRVVPGIERFPEKFPEKFPEYHPRAGEPHPRAGEDHPLAGELKYAQYKGKPDELEDAYKSAKAAKKAKGEQ